MFRNTRLQYFLTLAMLGTVLPYASVFFRSAGLSKAQVAGAYALYSLASVISPALVTMLADRFGHPRHLLAGLNALAAMSLGVMSQLHGLAPVLSAWTCYCLASVAVFPLLNGIHFGQQERRRDAGLAPTPYHLVRAWGTVGFISISLALFPMLCLGMNLKWVLSSGGILAALAAGQAMMLADPGRRAGRETRSLLASLPSLSAARALFSRTLFAFTTAVILVNMSSQVHAAYYPIYLTERVGLDRKWLGQASNLAVLIEIFLIFGAGRLTARFGVKRLLVVCMLATALRFGLLAATDNVWTAILTQAAHGLMVVATGVLPQTLFNDHAGERFRHSMQGMLVMLTSAGQVLSTLAASRLATYGIPAAYAMAAGFSLAAAVLVQVGYSDRRRAAGVEPSVRDSDVASVSPLIDVVPNAG